MQQAVLAVQVRLVDLAIREAQEVLEELPQAVRVVRVLLVLVVVVVVALMQLALVVLAGQVVMVLSILLRLAVLLAQVVAVDQGAQLIVVRGALGLRVVYMAAAVLAVVLMQPLQVTAVMVLKAQSLLPTLF